MQSGQRRHSLLDQPASLVLRALALHGSDAVDAFRRWRELVKLDDAGRAASRVMPLLVDLVRRENIDDDDLQRMQGVGRHIWTQNALNVRMLILGIDALAADGICPMLLKGMALFMRAPDVKRKRASTDSDILVAPQQLARAAGALSRGGFEPKGFRWEDFGPPLLGSETSGAALRLPGQGSLLDLHWRPLSSITNPALGEAFFARAVKHTLQGRTVLLPSATDQLFMALARCEPWDADECLTRLVEAHLLLSAVPDDVDWQALATLISTYRLEAVARAFLGDLELHAGLRLPADYLSRLDRAVTADRWEELEIRNLPPTSRTGMQSWKLRRMDMQGGRDQGQTGLPSLAEVKLRALGLNTATASFLWRSLRRRVPSGSVEEVRFLEGFTYPEAEGRWTVGHWSALAVPLTPTQQAGEPVRLNVHAFGMGARPLRVGATGGRETLSHVVAPVDPKLQLELRVKPLPELEGGGLILLWHPDAHSPSSQGLSSDKRQLGLFFRRPWGLQGHRPPPESLSLYRVLRQAYRRLPLPIALRSRLSPALGKVQQQLAGRTFRRPLPLGAIRRGDVVVSAYLTGQSGIARAGRLTRDSLRTWGVPLIEHDIAADPSAKMVGEVLQGGVWICHCNPPEVSTEVLVADTERLWASRYRIGVWTSELEQLPSTWPPMLKHFHEIWAPSQFAAEAIRRSSGPDGPVIRVVPHPMPEPGVARPLSSPHEPYRRFLIDQRPWA